MVRTYKRKTARGSYGTEALKEALAAVLSGTGIKTAARQFGIPSKTLRRHRDGKVREQRSRKRRAESATILTSSPYKKILTEKHEAKAKKNEKLRLGPSKNPTLGLYKKVGKKDNREPKSKKQTCRADKKRGRKPKNSVCEKKQSRRRMLNGKQPRPNTNDTQSLMNMCGNCGFGYGDVEDPLIDETWWRCVKCSRWFHESCGTARSYQFVCTNCDNS
jgi:hypothetical protein